MMLVQTCASPTSRTRCVTRPCGCERDRRRYWCRASTASQFDGIEGELADRRKPLVERCQCRQHRKQGFRWKRFNDQPLTVLSDDRLRTAKLELARNSHRLVSTGPEQFDPSFGGHADLL